MAASQRGRACTGWCSSAIKRKTVVITRSCHWNLSKWNILALLGDMHTGQKEEEEEEDNLKETLAMH